MGVPLRPHSRMHAPCWFEWALDPYRARDTPQRTSTPRMLGLTPRLLGIGPRVVGVTPRMLGIGSRVVGITPSGVRIGVSIDSRGACIRDWGISTSYYTG